MLTFTDSKCFQKVELELATARSKHVLETVPNSQLN